MSWNHRVIVTEHKLSNGEIETYFQIHEVYYDEDGKPNSCTANPITVGGDSPESLEWTIDKIRECLRKPFLWGDEKFPEIYRRDDEKQTWVRDESFVLEEWQAKSFEKWKKKQMKKDPSMPAAGERWTFMFTPTGIGTVIKVKDECTGEELDLTDWENW